MRLLPRGTDEERAFVNALAASPQDTTVRLAYADWLDEHERAEEAALLRDASAAPIITPFRVIPHWGAYRSGTSMVFVRTADVEMPPEDQIHVTYRSREIRAVVLFERLEAHRTAVHWHRVQPAQSPRPDVLVLNDEEALLAGIDRLPLLNTEPTPIIRPPSRPIMPETATGPKRS